MVGGKVVEVIWLPEKIWVNCRDKYSTSCAIYVERNTKSERIEKGDSVWWQSSWAFWTPASYVQGSGKGNIDYDIRINRIGYSGVSRPET